MRTLILPKEIMMSLEVRLCRTLFPRLSIAAEEDRYEVKVAEMNRESGRKTILQIVKGAYYPTFGAFFNYNTRESGAGRFISGGLDPDEPYRQIGFVEATEEIVVAPNMVTEIGNPLPFFEQLRLNDGVSYGFNLTFLFLMVLLLEIR